jgi:hypothetical protein
MTWLPPLDFWQGAALVGLALTAIGVGLAVVALVRAGRQQAGLVTLIAGAEERTQRILVQMETNAEARYRDLKDRLDDEEASPC